MKHAKLCSIRYVGRNYLEFQAFTSDVRKNAVSLQWDVNCYSE
jgi:hypothetical protein